MKPTKEAIEKLIDGLRNEGWEKYTENPMVDIQITFKFCPWCGKEIKWEI